MSVLNTLLVFCLAAGFSQPVCEAKQLAYGVGSPPQWATPRVRDIAAHIVAGEIPSGCKKCALWTFCTIWRDIERGWNPYALYPGRWHGWGYPRELEKEVLEISLTKWGCYHVPHCKYLGSERDWLYNWRHLGSDIHYNGIVCIEW